MLKHVEHERKSKGKPGNAGIKSVLGIQRERTALSAAHLDGIWCDLESASGPVRSSQTAWAGFPAASCQTMGIT